MIFNLFSYKPEQDTQTGRRSECNAQSLLRECEWAVS